MTDTEHLADDTTHSDDPGVDADATEATDRTQRPGPPQVDFPPVRNGIDYLTSVIELLDATQPSARDLKYAVLHLQAATEVLLKARLQTEHWSLIFTEPLNATREKFISGDFVSCTVEETIDRLQRLAGVRFEPKHLRAIKNLTQDRNKLQHYGLTHNALAIEGRAAEVLHFLLDFVHLDLSRHIDREEWERMDMELSMVRRGLGRMGKFVTTRMNDLKDEIAEVADHIVQCPDCDQWAAIVLHGSRCAFCHQVHDDAAFAASWYQRAREEIQGEDWTYQNDCPDCGAEHAFIGPVFFESARDQPRFACFHCQFTAATALCTRCARPFPAIGSRSECGTCMPPSPAVTTPRSSP
ncbi:hypothetical protein ACGRHY_27455 [Streptomyces sp. HK10]|uniref:hypothetical protein n=1 Tax=Streptomyces sp. HK10 TaxID=3373255 RepID=UPI003749A649